MAVGWWNQDEEGHSLLIEETGLIWGDDPADILDGAIEEIKEEFKKEWGRDPSNTEIRAGLEFSLGGDVELPDHPDEGNLDKGVS